jgi:hypothetical protein
MLKHAAQNESVKKAVLEQTQRELHSVAMAATSNTATSFNLLMGSFDEHLSIANNVCTPSLVAATNLEDGTTQLMASYNVNLLVPLSSASSSYDYSSSSVAAAASVTAAASASLSSDSYDFSATFSSDSL